MLMYKCRMCPETAFKWQSCLYKHFLINHFNEKIRSFLPEKEPFKCPKCEYVAKQKYILLLHYGITHKIVIKYLEEEEAARGLSMVVQHQFRGDFNYVLCNTLHNFMLFPASCNLIFTYIAINIQRFTGEILF